MYLRYKILTVYSYINIIIRIMLTLYNSALEVHLLAFRPPIGIHTCIHIKHWETYIYKQLELNPMFCMDTLL